MTINKMKYTSKEWLEKNEIIALNEGLAMMSYNPAIGRALRAGGVQKFKKIAVRKIRRLNGIRDQKSFDKFHDDFVRAVMKGIKKTSQGQKISYGHGQKAVNVFLKVYVDWASYPRASAKRIKRFLHTPLDYWVMYYIKKEHPEAWVNRVNSIYEKQRKEVGGFSLANIDKKIYLAWQNLCREICPQRPVLLDVIWAKAPRD